MVFKRGYGLRLAGAGCCRGRGVSQSGGRKRNIRRGYGTSQSGGSLIPTRIKKIEVNKLKRIVSGKVANKKAQIHRWLLNARSVNRKYNVLKNGSKILRTGRDVNNLRNLGMSSKTIGKKLLNDKLKRL